MRFLLGMKYTVQFGSRTRRLSACGVSAIRLESLHLPDVFLPRSLIFLESIMEQKFDGIVPKAELKLAGRKVTRSEVSNDWGLQLRWVVKRDGKEIATAPARTSSTYEFAETTAGKYEIVLQMFKYVDYKKDAAGEYTNSKFIEISNVVSYTI
jgi:hypothetical protein